jgi:hypothetical protein
MAKFMHIKISLMAEIIDADALREASLKNFDAADITSTATPRPPTGTHRGKASRTAA